MAVPNAIDRNNSATIWVRKISGASLVASDRLTGEISSSATVKTNSTPIRPSSGALFGTVLAIGMNSRNATPITMTPAANLIGVGGCRSPILVQIQAKTRDRIITNTGLIDCTQLTGISQPKMSRLSCLSEYSVTTVNCCWYSDQNTALTRNIGMNEYTRRRSVAVIFLLLRMTAK